MNYFLLAHLLDGIDIFNIWKKMKMNNPTREPWMPATPSDIIKEFNVSQLTGQKLIDLIHYYQLEDTPLEFVMKFDIFDISDEKYKTIEHIKIFGSL